MSAIGAFAYIDAACFNGGSKLSSDIIASAAYVGE
jgi:hypothetical protein